MMVRFFPSLIKQLLFAGIAAIWLLNGLYCKILGQVPRHQEIVSRILGDDHAYVLIKIIGGLEVLMVVWILSRIKSRWCAIFQISVVGIMNVLEFILAPDLLLFGKLNLVWAMLFMVLIYFQEFMPDQPNSIPEIKAS